MEIIKNKMPALKKIIAFTLAEILIVIGIIGIVAEMVLPGVVADTQKQFYTTQLKKAYSSFNQALTSITIANGCPNDLKCVSSLSSSSTFGDEIANYFKVVKNCGGVDNTGCFVSLTPISFNPAVDYGSVWTDMTSYRFITADGIAYRYLWMNCLSSTFNYSSNATGDLQQVCGSVNIDLNNTKLPNKYGKDIFIFYIANGKGAKLYPLGGIDDNNKGYWNGTTKYCTGTNYNGLYCAARIIEEGWQINYY